jgi:glycerophosphoryl diester phosphodiesterase
VLLSRRNSFALFVCLVLVSGAALLVRATRSSPAGDILGFPIQAPACSGCHTHIAHALGAIGGVLYTNSVEAFAASYAKGFRVFEVDLARTRDGHIVAMHDWRASWSAVPRLADFKAHRIGGRFTPATLGDVLGMLRAHPDAYLVLDFKGEVSELLPTIVAEAVAMDSSLPARIIPQVSNLEEVKIALQAYHFPSEILTLYRSDASDAQVVALVAHTGIRVVTMSTRRFTPGLVAQLDSLGAKVYVHTVNDPDSAADFRAKGVWGIYTDSLAPSPDQSRCVLRPDASIADSDRMH